VLNCADIIFNCAGPYLKIQGGGFWSLAPIANFETRVGPGVPVTMHFKNTGELGKKSKSRICVDYRDLNRLILPDLQPMPLIDEIIARTAVCSWLSALDINSVFWLIPIWKEDRIQNWVRHPERKLWMVMPSVQHQERSRDLSTNPLENPSSIWTDRALHKLSGWHFNIFKFVQRSYETFTCADDSHYEPRFLP